MKCIIEMIKTIKTQMKVHYKFQVHFFSGERSREMVRVRVRGGEKALVVERKRSDTGSERVVS